MTWVSATLLQHGEGSHAYVLDGKAILTQQDVAGGRCAETIDADHITMVPEVAMPAVRWACFDRKARSDRRRQNPLRGRYQESSMMGVGTPEQYGR